MPADHPAAGRAPAQARQCARPACAPALPALPHVATGRAEIAAVLVDQRGVAALGAGLARHRGHAGRRARGLGLGRFEDAHLAQREALFAQYTQHGITVDDEARHIGHGAGPDLLAFLTGHRGHEMAQRLAHVEQLAQLHAHPGGVDDAHVQREQTGQAVERARVVAREAQRTGARDETGG